MKIILVETEGSANIGSIARLMKNFGHKELYLMNPKCEISEESKKMACNAQEVLNKAKIINKLTDSKADYFIGTSALEGSEYNIPRNPSNIKEIPKNKKAAIVLGSESQGLSTKILKEMDMIIKIPADKNYPTLNISHALGIILYELFEKEENKEKLASIEQKERLTKLFYDRMNKEGMTDKEKETAYLTFKKLLGRSAITSREIAALFGSFKRL